MGINRRGFLKAAVAGGLMFTAGPGWSVQTQEHKFPPKAVGILYDSNLCIGCQACVVACKRANDMPAEHSGRFDYWDNPLDLSAKTLNVIKMYTRGQDFAFIKRHCMHCLEPACVNGCPVSALQKDPETGVVTYNKDACIGCRYCQIACPYNIPKFEWDSPFPVIRKCEFCQHLFDQGGYPACCAFCPTGASLFGPAEKLKEEAERRLLMRPGKYYRFPLNHIEQDKSTQHKAKPYVEHIYGDLEVGGSQVMMLAGTSFTALGLPDLPQNSYVSELEGVSKGIYKYMLLPVAALGALIYLAKKRGIHEE